MPRGPKPQPPIFDRDTALKLRERYLQGETLQAIAESMSETKRRVDHSLRKHGVISKEDTSQHTKILMQKRKESGIRVGRKPKPDKKKG